MARCVRMLLVMASLASVTQTLASTACHANAVDDQLLLQMPSRRIQAIANNTQACPQPKPRSSNGGAPWTEEEALIVKAKIEKLFSRPNLLSDKIESSYECNLEIGQISAGELQRNGGGECRPTIQGAAGFTPPKVLRLGFHDCLRYEDCTGGCDGCLNFHGMFIQYIGRNLEKDFPKNGDNNNLAYTADGLEMIFQDASFPSGAPALSTSLQKRGRSRADLWVFATLVAIEKGFEANDQLCHQKTSIKNEFAFPREDVELQRSLLAALGLKCVIGAQHMKFMTGRKDCEDVGPQRAYEASKEERHPSAHANGNELVQFFKDNFGPAFTGRDTAALMGAHSLGGATPSSLFQYTWTRTQSKSLNHEYFRNLMEMPKFMMSGGLGQAGDVLGNALSNGEKTMWLTGVGHRPGRVTWQPERLGDRKFGAPFLWKHIFEMCPECYRLKNGTWKNRGRKIKGGKENGKFYTDACCRTCYEDKKTDPDCMTYTANDEMAMHSDVGLYFKFDTTSYGRQTGCKGFNQHGWENDDLWMTNVHSTFPPPSYRFLRPHGCELQDLDSGDGKPLHAVVEEYAENQDLWVRDFLIAIEKMQHNGYAEGDLVEGPDVFNKHIVCETVRGVLTCKRVGTSGQTNPPATPKPTAAPTTPEPTAAPTATKVADPHCKENCYTNRRNWNRKCGWNRCKNCGDCAKIN